MRDASVPTREQGYLDLEVVREQRILEDAAILWIADYVELYEGEALLPAPVIAAVRVSLQPIRRSEAMTTRSPTRWASRCRRYRHLLGAGRSRCLVPLHH